MKYSIKDSTLNELAHQLRLSMEKYTDMPTYHFVEIDLSDDEQIYAMEMPEDYAPECNSMRVRVEIPTNRKRYFPIGYCSGYYETVEEAKQASDYTVINWEDSDDEAGIMIRYILASARAITFVVDGDTNGNSMYMFVEAFLVPDEEPGFTMEGIVGNIGGLMPSREVEELEITENGTYGEDVEVGAPLYNRVIVNVPAEEPVLEEIEIIENGEYSPDDGVDGFSTVIVNVPTGGGDIEVEPLVLRGECLNTCSGPLASTYIEMFGDTISTKDIVSSADMFSRFQGLSIPFEVNMKSGASHTMPRMFQYANYIEELPKINNANPSSVSYMFHNCNNLRNIPEDWVDTWDFTTLHTSTVGQCNFMFYYCYSLRKIPTNLLTNLWSKNTGSYTLYSSGWTSCYALDELVGIPIQPASLTTNKYTSAVDSCYRLKNFTFEVNEDGSPKTATWKSQIIDLSKVGYGGDASSFTNYNSGITEDKLVKNDTTYQALKNDPDWFTANYNYCRYNHDSAVETINSLPDTSAYLASAGGTNTIKFKGASGALTDGGAINTLTEEEIAVAASKGWTVTFV